MRFHAVVCSFVFIPVFILPAAAQETGPAYRDSKLTVEERAADLLKRLTLEEKVDQLGPGAGEAHGSSPEEKQIFDDLRKLWREDAQLSPHDAAEIRNRAQHFFVEKTRLGIPAIFQGEALHGYMAYSSTSFPQVLGLASTWDPDLVQQDSLAERNLYQEL